MSRKIKLGVHRNESFSVGNLSERTSLVYLPTNILYIAFTAYPIRFQTDYAANRILYNDYAMKIMSNYDAPEVNN